MKKDVFKRTLQHTLSKYGAEYSRIADKLTERIYFYLEAGDSIADAFKKARKEVNFFKLNKDAIEDAVYESALKGYGINAPALEVGVEGEKAIKNKLASQVIRIITGVFDNIQLRHTTTGKRNICKVLFHTANIFINAVIVIIKTGNRFFKRTVAPKHFFSFV